MGQDDESLPILLAIDLEGSFDLVVNTYARELYSFAWHRTGNLQDAEDIVQEVYLRAFDALKRYPEERIRALHLRPWLYAIMANICRNKTRKKSMQDVTIQYLQHDLVADLEVDLQQLPEHIIEVAESNQETESLVSALLSTLPPPYYETIYLFYFQEQSCEEIANRLKRPLGTVKSYLSRGRELLRKAIQTKLDEVQ